MSDVLRKCAKRSYQRIMCFGQLGGFSAGLGACRTIPHIYASVGVHPDTKALKSLISTLGRVGTASQGHRHRETGLDYFRLKGDLEWQRARFATISAQRARVASRSSFIPAKPQRTTLRIMAEETLPRRAG